MPNRSKFLELADELADAIRGGEYEPNDRFPTVMELAKKYGVAPNTCSRAVQVLKERGLLSGKPGGTTRVRVQPIRRIRTNTRYQAEKDLVLRPEEERATTGVAELDSGVPLSSMYEDHATYAVMPAPDDVREALNLPPGAAVLRRIYTRRHAKSAGVDRSTSYIPYDLVSGSPDLLDSSREPWPGGTMHQLYTIGIELDRIEDQVTASMPTPEEIRDADIPPSVPVLRIRKISYSTDGDPVEVMDIPMPADRGELSYITRLERW
ncbi:GntR family transcriptional regulator [Streptomyces olivaceoviridis]|uniref:GntR family transcriptional regulator n=1 Tax=Streptomyces olivaceoviridis TaxID=1921 RepID=UPI0036F91BA6